MQKEFKLLTQHKGLMLTMVAIILIPFFYSFCFLTSAWDPYGNTGKIPVAVVNLDQPASLQGTKITAGADTVKQLHDDSQLEWHFVSAAQAAKGMKDNDYYTVVTIPKNFSARAATALDAHPKQMKLTYQTNGSLNYVSEIISQVGADKLNSQIKEKVTEAFVSELFAKIGTIGKGMKTAADGSTKLAKGVKQYTNGVTQVDDGVGQLYAAVPALTSGVQQLTDGGNQLYVGLGQLNGKVPALASGIYALNDGSGQLYNGLGQLKGQVPALTAGVDQLNTGSLALKNGLKSINGEVNGKTPDTDLTGSVQDLTDGMNLLYAAVTQPSEVNGTKYPAMQAGVQKLVDGLEELKKKTVPTLPTGAKALSTAMTKLHTKVNSQITTLKMLFNDTNFQANAIYNNSGFKTQADAVKSAQTTADANLQTAIDAVTDQTQKDALQAAFDKDKAASSNATSKVNMAYMALNTVKYNLATTEVESTINPITGTGDPKGLQAAVAMFDTQLKTLSDGLNVPAYSEAAGEDVNYEEALDTVLAGVKHLNENVPALIAGAKQLDDGLNTLNGKAPKLTAGISDLYTGSTKLSTGLGQLNGSTPALGNGVNQLYNGSSQLAAGLGQLKGNVPALSTGVNQLYTGSGQLATGLNQLNGQVPTLASGVTQLKDGTSQLTANNKELNDGTGQLATGLNDGYDQIAATKLTKLTAKMFASPSKDVQVKYSSVKNYGAALAPYVLALALFIAIIIFNFAYPMKRRDDDDRSLFQWLGAKVAMGTLVAVGAAVAEATLILLISHLPVANIPGFYAITILFALSAMYLTQMLNIAFDRFGIFIALGLLTLSGSGGLFPAETISPLYESTQKFLPMTYAINGYRDAISGGIAGDTVAISVMLLVVVALISLALMLPAAQLRSPKPAKD